MKTTRIFIMLLAFVLMAGCAEIADETALTESDITETQMETSHEAELPVADFGGYEFGLLWPEPISGNHFIRNELWVEAENGEVINDSVFKRNLSVEENYNIDIVCDTQSFSAIPGTVSKMVIAGDYAYDAFCTQIAQISPVAMKDEMADFRNMTYWNEDMPWWNYASMNDLSIGGKVFFGTGDIIYSDDFYVYHIMCNLKLIEDYDLENPYETVRSGKWTIDKMIEMANGVSEDLNNDGSYGWEDKYGITLVNSGTKALFYGSGLNVTGKDKDGLPYLTIYSEKTQSVLEKILEVYYIDNMTLNGNKKTATSLGLDHANTTEKCFNENRAIFLVTSLIAAERIRAAEVMMGLMPMPKYDASQEDYICVLNDMTLLGVPIIAPDLDRTSLILSAMSKESVSTLTPAFFEIVLTEKYLRDTDSVEMLDIIFNTVKVPDLGTTFNYGSIWSGFVDLVVKNSTDFTSFYEKTESKAIADINKAITEIGT